MSANKLIAMSFSYFAFMCTDASANNAYLVFIYLAVMLIFLNLIFIIDHPFVVIDG